MKKNCRIDYSDKELIKVLKKIYSYKPYDQQNYHTDPSRDIDIFDLPEELSEKEKAIFKNSGYVLNDVKHFEHDKDIHTLRALGNSDDLKMHVRQLFFKAMGEGFHRGLQPIISFYSACNIPEHTYEPASEKNYRYEENKVPCKICGLIKDEYVNASRTLYYFGIGLCTLENSYKHIVDLEEIRASSFLKQDENYVDTFSTLLRAIEAAPKDETPSELEKRIGKLKILPNSNLCSRTWLLRCLSTLGIIPNKIHPKYSVAKDFITFENQRQYNEELEKEAVNHRSELQWPYSAWRGKMGVDWQLAYELFSELER